MINVGIIGTGFGAKVHIPGFQKLPEVKIMAIAGKNKSETKAIAEQHHIPLTYSRWQNLIKNPQIQAVSIATPPFLHFQIIQEALKQKKAILCEKPFCTNVQQSGLLEKMGKKNKIINAVDFEFRYAPHFQELKKQLEKKSIGKINYCKIVWITGGRANKNFPLNWMNYKKLGGGMLLNYGSHVIDYTEWLLGPISSVVADLKIIKNSAVATADDFCHFFSLLQNGIPVQVTISNVLYGGEGHTIEIYGDKGTLKLSNHNLFDAIKGFSLIKIDNRNKTTTIKIKNPPPATDGRIFPFCRLAKDFIMAIQKKKTLTPTFTTGVHVHQVIAAIYKSAHSKKWIKIFH